ncbi:MAG: hypothetical protein RLZZ618_2651 [Pseudomonadota bacterium]
MHIDLANMRKGWSVLLAYCVVSFMAGLYSYWVIERGMQPLSLVQLALDAVALYGLCGYVFRKPIRHFPLRLLYIALALVLCARAVAAVYAVAPNLSPWLGDREQYVSVLVVLSAALALLFALALWLYATKSQVAPSPPAE